MENEKIVKWLEKKLTQDEILIGIDPARLIIKSNKKIPVSIVVTTKHIFYIVNLSIQRKQKIQKVQTITISAISFQMIIHTFEDDDSWVQSNSRPRIIKNFLYVRQKFLMDQNPFPVNISLQSSLQEVLPKAVNKTQKLFKHIFRLGQSEGSSIEEIKSRQSQNFLIIKVTEKDYKMKIGAKIYESLYKNIKLLYTSGSLSFRFIEEHYEIQQEKIPETAGNDSPQKTSKDSTLCQTDRILLRRINKGNEIVDENIADMLRKYRNLEYKEEIFYAIETETHFQIITRYQKNIHEITFLSGQVLQVELRSIFHRLINLIEGKTQAYGSRAKSAKFLVNQNESQKFKSRINSQKFIGDKVRESMQGKYGNVILYSLCPENIFIDENKKISISQVFSSLEKSRILEYMAPEQFYEQISVFNEEDIQLINLWKAGVLIYEIAYGNVPFSVDYIAYCAKSRSPIKVSFPSKDTRSNALQNLLKTLLVLEPYRRGGPGKQGWKQKILKCKWMG